MLSKALAETVVTKEGQGLPIGIFRPSISTFVDLRIDKILISKTVYQAPQQHISKCINGTPISVKLYFQNFPGILGTFIKIFQDPNNLQSLFKNNGNFRNSHKFYSYPWNYSLFSSIFQTFWQILPRSCAVSMEHQRVKSKFPQRHWQFPGHLWTILDRLCTIYWSNWLPQEYAQRPFWPWKWSSEIHIHSNECPTLYLWNLSCDWSVAL